MKTQAAKVALLAIASMLYITVSNAQNTNEAFSNIKVLSHPRNTNNDNNVTTEAKVKFFELRIEVVNDNDNTISATVKVYHGDTLVAVLNSDLQPKMRIEFGMNQHYKIQVQKPGFITKTIVVSTTVPKEVSSDDNESYIHETTISLIKRSAAASDVDSTYSNTLAGMICYNAEQDNFVGVPIIPEEMTTQGNVLAQVQNQGY